MVDIVPGFEDMVIYDDAKLALKGDTLLALAKKYKLYHFVETGTYAGEMVKYLLARREWEQIYSIELGQQLAYRATKLFENNPNVWILQGDSGETLKAINMKTPTLYWLDSHYCGGVTALGSKITPVMEELETILASKLKHVIVVDDLDNLPKWGISPRDVVDFMEKNIAYKALYYVVDTMLICVPEEV